MNKNYFISNTFLLNLEIIGRKTSHKYWNSLVLKKTSIYKKFMVNKQIIPLITRAKNPVHVTKMLHNIFTNIPFSSVKPIKKIYILKYSNTDLLKT